MSKLIQASVDVTAEQGWPMFFFYQKKRRVERIFDFWREQGRWWQQEQELHIFKVVADGSLFELHYLPQSAAWQLYRIYD